MMALCHSWTADAIMILPGRTAKVVNLCEVQASQGQEQKREKREKKRNRTLMRTELQSSVRSIN